MSDTTTTKDSTQPSAEFERGAREAAESMRFYFLDENEHSLHAELSTEILEHHEAGAVVDALAHERLRLERLAQRIAGAAPEPSVPRDSVPLVREAMDANGFITLLTNIDQNTYLEAYKNDDLDDVVHRQLIAFGLPYDSRVVVVGVNADTTFRVEYTTKISEFLD